jgi:uncharacterized protein YdeI (YjbR/CyaY-like superfamily)
MRKRDEVAIKTLEVHSRQEWRKWLSEHYNSQSEIWLIFRKQQTGQTEHTGHAGVTSLGYIDAVEEALCFGWIDSLVRRLDDVRYARKFTPRKADSKWSTINRRRYAELKSRGLLETPGLERAPTSRSGDAPRPSASAIPSYIEERLKADPRAWQYFEQLAPSYRRAYIGWIESAKREETKEKRLQEAISLLAAGKKLGLK